MVTITLNLALIGIILASYYTLTVTITLVILLTNPTTRNRPLKQTLKLIPRSLLIGPLLPYLVYQQARQQKREQETLNRYRAARAADPTY